MSVVDVIFKCRDHIVYSLYQKLSSPVPVKNQEITFKSLPENILSMFGKEKNEIVILSVKSVNFVYENKRLDSIVVDLVE